MYRTCLYFYTNLVEHEQAFLVEDTTPVVLRVERIGRCKMTSNHGIRNQNTVHACYARLTVLPVHASEDLDQLGRVVAGCFREEAHASFGSLCVGLGEDLRNETFARGAVVEILV